MATGPRRAVIVTGGAAGIGWATARRLARRGDRIAILDRDATAATARADGLGGDHFALSVDVGDEAALVAAIAAAHARFGRLDILVNNAATIYSGGGATLDLDLDAYRRLVAVNAGGVHVAAREAAAILRAQGAGGTIVNVASLAGVVAVPGRTAYSASKAAVIGLTRVLARELAPSGIRVNAVLPGFTATETYRASQRERAVDGGRLERRIPLGRMAEPDEIAAAIEHLAATDADASVGALLTVDGGFHAYGGIDDASAGGMDRPDPRAAPRVALIVGDGGAIGAAVAARLAAGGARLALLDDGTGHRAAAGPETIVMTAPIDRPSLDAAVESALARFGRIDLLVSAGDGHAAGSFGDRFDGGPTRALLAAQAVAPAMIGQRGGAIVNLCAAAAPPADAGEAAVQAATAVLSRSFACEWARHGIRANTVVHGRSARAASGVAAAVDFLGSDDASYITGATYCADAGAAWRS